MNIQYDSLSLLEKRILSQKMRSWKKNRSILLLNVIFLIIFSFSIIPPQQQNSEAEPIEVTEILKAAAAYCQKLEHSVLYFV